MRQFDLGAPKTKLTKIIQADTGANHTGQTRLSPLQKLGTILAFYLISFAVWVVLSAYFADKCLWNFVYDSGPRYWFDLLTMDLAVTGICYAFFHDFELNEQTKRMDNELNELIRLEGALSTRRIGPFPQHLDDIRMLAEKAETAMCLDMLVDCFDYGSFFEPGRHQTVHDSICGAVQRGVRVRLLVCAESGPQPLTGGQNLSRYSEQEREELLTKYFSALRGDPRFTKWVQWLVSERSENLWRSSGHWFKQSGESLKSTLTECFNAYTKNVIPERKDENRLLMPLLQLRQLWFAWRFQEAKLEIQGVAKDESMFFWIKYKDQTLGKLRSRNITDDALFTFANKSSEPGQLGYTTHDWDLLTNFVEMFDEKWQKAKSSKAPPWLEFLRGIAIAE